MCIVAVADLLSIDLLQYIHHLRTYTSTIDTVVFSTLATPDEGTTEERAFKLVKGVWEGVLEVAGI